MTTSVEFKGKDILFMHSCGGPKEVDCQQHNAMPEKRSLLFDTQRTYPLYQQEQHLD